MSISAPSSYLNPIEATAEELIVLLGDEEGNAPAVDDEVDYLIPQRVGWYANGGRDDILTFQVDLELLEERLVDTEAPVGYQRQVEVRMLDENGDPTDVLGWGFISKQHQTIDDRQEGMILEARLDKTVFGLPLTSYPVYDGTEKPANPPLVAVERKMVFNPEIDEQVLPNMSDQLRAVGDEAGDEGEGAVTPGKYNYFLDPESVRTTQAEGFQDQTASLWPLANAVYMLCWWLNPYETWILNPTLDELRDVFVDRDDLVKNIEIPFGVFLPDALDALLLPCEYGWHLIHELNEDGGRETRMRFYERGTGISKEVLMQRPGDFKSFDSTNVNEWNVSISLTDMANNILVYGANLKRESTFILQKGWDASDDTLDLADLEVGQPTAIDKPFVGRKWVLNEAGDYIGRRPEITEAYDLDSLFDTPTPARRRKFEQCLSQRTSGDDEESFRFRVDWYDSTQDGASDSADKDDPGWIQVKWPFSVLEKECGILIEGATPPDALWSLMQPSPDQAKVRITATLRGDSRIQAIATRRPQSPNGMDVALVLDMGNKFQDSAVSTDSIFDGKPNIARDDTAKIQKYAEDVRDIEDCAQVNCSMILEGINHPDFEIGDLVNQAAGRNISLNGYVAQTGVEPRCPQIVGFNFLVAGGQRLELLMESFKAERPEV